MPESVIGAKTTDILHQKKTKEGSLTVTHNTGDIVANTIGHVLAVPTTHTILWTWGSAFKNPTPELANQLFERYKDVPWKGDVLVRVGQTDIVGDIQRIFAQNEDIRGRPWMLKDKFGHAIEFVGKVSAAFLSTLEAIKAKLTRSDFYNPFANTATIYHPKLAPGMHELGHAEWFNQMGGKSRIMYISGLTNKLIYLPFFRSFVEWKATANAMRHYKNDGERRQALKIHEAAWGTYIGFDSLIALAVASPAFALPLINAAALKVSGELILGKKIITATLAAALHPYGSSLAGHFMNRLYPKKDQRFGYIFSGTDKQAVVVPKKQELSAHQVLVATARAPKYNGKEVHVEGKGGRQFSEEPLKNGQRPQHSNTSRITF